MRPLARVLVPILFLSLTAVHAGEVARNRAMKTAMPQVPKGTAAFIKFDGIDGEAQDKHHKDWIDVLSVSQSPAAPETGTTAARRRGDVVLEDLTVTKAMDKASPELAEAHETKRVFPKVEIHTATDADGQTYMVYELKNVMVTSYSSGGSGDDRPTETITLNFEKVDASYSKAGQDENAKGKVETSWKVEEGAK